MISVQLRNSAQRSVLTMKWEEMSNRVDKCIGITASLCCTTETNILKQLYSNKNSLKLILKGFLKIPEARGLSEPRERAGLLPRSQFSRDAEQGESTQFLQGDWGRGY